MAKSLASILSQIERLQKEAASIQSEVVARIRKDIAKYGLTAEQLFGATGSTKPSRAVRGAQASKVVKPPKYADGTGNTWGGMGKRPEWIRQALAAGKALEDFLIEKSSAPSSGKAKTPKAAAAKRVASKPTAARKPATKKSATTKRTSRRTSRAQAAQASSEA